MEPYEEGQHSININQDKEVKDKIPNIHLSFFKIVDEISELMLSRLH